ncbi:class I SAM-dependent methyltransferase [Entomobacter blattae]|uniref:Methyltransferase type 11 domain-containing protein n=1 Tax=Entomobacter blattae TaxID=2762277 RepID=A0A7H1NQ48_9PROT|nr:methyltransferase domain-containing protein [Entomobacter blattae]QNT77908.1 hypothetical protein JGUZn3_06660 [Entomobacter blattae]
MASLKNLHPKAFLQANSTPDKEFYASISHDSFLDQGADKAVKTLYSTILEPHTTLLDLMAGEESHLPTELPFSKVFGIGINANTLNKNPQLDKTLLIDLNTSPTLPFADESFEAVCCCDGIAYCTNSSALLKEVWRVLKPSCPVILSFGERFLPAKAVALWQALSMEDRQRMLTLLLKQAGFTHTDEGSVHPPEDIPFWQQSIYANIGYK